MFGFRKLPELPECLGQLCACNSLWHQTNRLVQQVLGSSIERMCPFYALQAIGNVRIVVMIFPQRSAPVLM